MGDRQVAGINLNALSSDVEYNILLIGANGLKNESWFCDAFARYFKFGSLGEAIGEAWNERIKSSVVSSQRVYTFRQKDKFIRLIDPCTCMEGTSFKEYIRAMRSCVANYPKVHAIVLVVDGILEYADFEINVQNLLSLLSIIPKSACNNVVLCLTKKLTCEISNETFAQLQSNIASCTTITAHRGQNVLIMDSRVRECLVDYSHGDIYSDVQIKKCRTSWIEESEQFQTMVDYVASRDTCEMTNMIELMQALNLLSYYKKDYSSDSKGSSSDECLIENEDEQIVLKLLALMAHLTMIRPLVMVKSIFQFSSNLESDDKFLNKLQLSENRQLVEFKLNQCSATDYFHELFNELSKVPHTGSVFAYKITLLRSDEMEHVVSILIKNNLLLVDLAATADRYVEMSDLTFSCDLSSQTVNLVLNNLSNFLNITQSDIQFFADNINCFIKDNFVDQIPVILCNCLPKKELNRNKQHDDCFCLIM